MKWNRNRTFANSGTRLKSKMFSPKLSFAAFAGSNHAIERHGDWSQSTMTGRSGEKLLLRVLLVENLF